jgi:cell wall assembly regulator SMI1
MTVRGPRFKLARTMGDVDAGATDSMIEAVESRLRHRFPDDYRTFLKSENGFERWFGDVYLSLYTIEEVVGFNETHDHLAYQPELIHIGSDGGGEAIAFDFRQDPPTVILVNLVSTDWSEAIVQAESFTEFMHQRRRGEELRWRG